MVYEAKKTAEKSAQRSVKIMMGEVNCMKCRVWESGTKIHIGQWDLLQSTLLREHCLLLITTRTHCFEGMLLFSLQVMLHVLFPDLIFRSEDIDRKRRLTPSARMDETPSDATVEVYEAQSSSISMASRSVSGKLSLPVQHRPTHVPG